MFIPIGLQLRAILADLERYSVPQLFLYGAIVSAVTILVRLFWVFGAAFLPEIIGRQRKKSQDLHDGNTWKNVVIVAWTGTRGVVSLATALALPFTINGSALPHRSLILFLAFVVIFVTLVIQGLSLPLLLKILKINTPDTANADEHELRLTIANSVLNFIDQELPDKISEGTREEIRKKYIDMIASLTESKRKTESDSASMNNLSPVYELLKAQSEINKFQRKLLIGYHQTGAYKQSAIRQVEQQLDLEEVLFNRKPKKKH